MIDDDNLLHQKAYHDAWRQILVVLLDWSNEDVEAWASRYSAEFEQPASLMYHEDPEWYVAREFIPIPVEFLIGWFGVQLLRDEIAELLKSAFRNGRLAREKANVIREIDDAVARHVTRAAPPHGSNSCR